MRREHSERSLPADSHHHTASTLDRVAQVVSYATPSGVGDMAGTQSAGRLRTLSVLRISGRLFLWNP